MKRSRQKQSQKRRMDRKPGDPGKSRYARKAVFRHKNLSGDPLPFYPELMALPSDRKPWG